jgi:pimeloyl-ACP methyl ester carboxylesterase
MMRAFVGCRIFWRIMFTEATSRFLRSAPVACPVSIVWGNKDAVLPLRVSADRWQRELPDAEWHLWLGVGHMPMVDEPRRTVEVIEQTTAQAKLALSAVA